LFAHPRRANREEVVAIAPDPAENTASAAVLVSDRDVELGGGTCAGNRVPDHGRARLCQTHAYIATGR
jgi:hypothetical protein